MTKTIQKEFNSVSEFFELIKVNQKNNFVLLFNINLFLKDHKEKELINKSITVRIILPKTIIFDPIQNDHIIIDPFVFSESYLLSWKINCLKLPCQTSNIKVEISF
ncbi:MAG: hypothetical protein ACW981_06280 [Candidatus Hodarchaeales archaeon]